MSRTVFILFQFLCLHIPLAAGADGKQILTGSEDGTAILWE